MNKLLCGILLGMIPGYAFNYIMENIWFFVPQFHVITTCVLVTLAAILIVTQNDLLYGLAAGCSFIIVIFIGDDLKAHITGGVSFIFLFGIVYVIRMIFLGKKTT